MIDANAFGEWIVAKAAKQGAFESAENLRVAREAVEVALARDGDDIHVTCVLAGSSGGVRVDERMTRTAVGVLFPKVANAHPEPLFQPKPETRAPAPGRSRHDKELELDERRGAEARLERKIVAIVIAVIMAIVLAVTAITVAVNEREDEHEAPTHDKREMHH